MLVCVNALQCNIGGAVLHICDVVGSRAVHSVRHSVRGLYHPAQCDGLCCCCSDLLPIVGRRLSLVVALHLQRWVSLLLLQFTNTTTHTTITHTTTNIITSSCQEKIIVSGDTESVSFYKLRVKSCVCGKSSKVLENCIGPGKPWKSPGILKLWFWKDIRLS